MNTSDSTTLSAYKALCDKMDKNVRLPAMQPGTYRCESQTFDDPEPLWNAFSASAPVQGWLQFQSHQCAFFDGLPTPQANWGILLAAEAYTDDGASLTVGQNGAGGWVLGRCEHAPDQSSLYDEVRHLAHDPKIGALRYRRYWRFDPEQGYVQDRACFIGFE